MFIFLHLCHYIASFIACLLHYITPLHPLWDIRLQWALHCIRSLASPHDRFICSSSCVTVLRQGILGLPGFLLPGGVHLKVIFVMRSCSILSTCPSHLRRLCVISLMMLQLPVFLYSSLLEILLGKKSGIFVGDIHFGTLPFSSCLFWQLASFQNRTAERIYIAVI